MTRPKAPHELKRPRRILGNELGQHIRCPLCRLGDDPYITPEDRVGYQGHYLWSDFRVIKYRERSARLECKHCGVRFTIDFQSVADALRKRDLVREANVIDQARQVFPGSSQVWAKPE